MPVIKLLQKNALQFRRIGDDLDKGYYDKSGQYVSATTVTLIDAVGNLQPWTPYNNQLVLPEGTREQDLRIYYTKTELRVVDQYENLPADETTIDGDNWTVFTKQPWTGYSLTPDHNSYVLIRDNPRSGTQT